MHKLMYVLLNSDAPKKDSVRRPKDEEHMTSRQWPKEAIANILSNPLRHCLIVGLRGFNLLHCVVRSSGSCFH